MNTNVLMIDTICNRLSPVASPLQKGGMVDEGKWFSLFRDNISSQETSDKKLTSYNTLDKNHKMTIEKDFHEFEPEIRGKAETANAIRDQEEIRQKSSPTCNSCDPPDLELACSFEKYGLLLKNGESEGEGNANIQVESFNPTAQADGFPLVSGEIAELNYLGLMSIQEDLIITGSVQGDILQDPSEAHMQLETTENIDILPTGMTAQTNENKPLTSDSSAAVEIQKQTVSNTKDVFGDVFNNDDAMTSAGDEKSISTNMSPIITQAKILQTQLDAAEADSNKRAPTDEAISELQYLKGKESIQTGDSDSNAPGIHTVNIIELQTSTGQSNTQGRSSDFHRFQNNLDQVHLQNENPAPILQPSANLIADAKPNPSSGQPSPSEITADVGRQILESIQSSLTPRDGDQQITVRLNPPELGTVIIKFQEQNSELTGLLEVNKTETRIEIEHALPQIIRDLADCGIQIRRIDVMLSESNRSGSGALEGQFSQNNGPYEHDAAGSQTWDNDAYANGMNDWTPKNMSYPSVSELQPMAVGDSSINVLI